MVKLDLTSVDIYGVLSAFDEGVIITDQNGVIIFYNKKQAVIDDLNPKSVIGKKVTEIYDLDETSSKILQCMKTGRPIRGELLFYRTHLGRVANTIHSVFPLFTEGSVVGAACFVKDYNMLEETIAASSNPVPRNLHPLGNGTQYQFTDIVSVDEKFLHAVKTARLASDSPSPIMLYGETGTGKELFAQSIHNYSGRHRKPFVGINCAAIPENLLEGLLFGTTRGAFTGAVNKEGIFEQAHSGTLFLDEVNAMPITLQAKLLRAIQEKKIRRIGATEDMAIDLKIISSVNTDPHQAIRDGHLRMDLFYRLGVVFIRIPPLRERRSGIETLVRHFIYKNNLKLGRHVKDISPDVMDFFISYGWPGNVRELEHIIEGVMNVVGDDEIIQASHLPTHFFHPDYRTPPDPDHRDSDLEEPKPSSMAPEKEKRVGTLLPEVVRQKFIGLGARLPEAQKNQELEMISRALSETGGNISRSARMLGISRQLLHYKINKHGIDRGLYKTDRSP